MQRPTRYGAPDPEVLSNEAIEMPLGYCRPTPLQDMIANMVRQAVEEERGEEMESLEDADDFEEEDPDTLDFSRYTFDEIQEDYIPPFEEEPRQDGSEANPSSGDQVDAPQEQTGDTPDQDGSEPS